ASIYTLKLLRRGVDIRRGLSVNVLEHVTASQAMRPDCEQVGKAEGLIPVLSHFVDSPGEAIFVVDDDRNLLGTITTDDIRPLLADPQSVGSLIIAKDMMREAGFPVFAPGDSLDEVMRRFGNYRFQAPVVEDGRLVGSLWPQDVIEAYNAELLKRDMASSMALAASHGPVTRALPGVRGMSMAEVPAPLSFLGKSLGSLDVRSRYRVTILLIKRTIEGGERIIDELPDADYVFEEGDVLLVMGTEERLRRFETVG
ncbi:MAG: CBS domain-containing protein, partial [bacterium]|nr:CBS domain-containing protein [bacterium]